MQSNHKIIEHKLHGSLVRIQGALELLEFDRALYESAEECKRLIETKQYNVAVMGEFKRGKSTLINALLGSAVLPADVTPTTATVNRITYGREQKAVVRFKDGSEKEIGIGELADYVTKITPDGGARAATVKEAVVYCHATICQNHIDIIDTPGLNDDENMTKITLDTLDGVDAVIMPIHAKIPFSETERKFVCRLILSGGIDNIVFVINFMDSLDEDDYVYETYLGKMKNRIQTDVMRDLEGRGSGDAVIAKARRLLENMNICGISAKLALKSKSPDSRFEEFREILRRSVTSKQVDNAVNKTIDSVERIISEFESQDRKRLDYFDGKARAIQSCDAAVSVYDMGVNSLLNGIFAEDPRTFVDNAATGLNDYKSLIVGIFIRELSTVRVDMHAWIRDALKKAQNDASETVKRKLKDEFNKGLYDSYLVSAGQLINYRKSKLDGIFETLNISDGNGNLTAVGLAAYAETVLRGVDFDWSVSPIPDAGDLAKVNVIDAVRRAADAAVESLKDKLIDAVTAIRSNWHRQFDEDTKSVRDTVIKTVETRRKELDEQKITYTNNYRKFCESSKAILSECESVRAESFR